MILKNQFSITSYHLTLGLMVKIFQRSCALTKGAKVGYIGSLGLGNMGDEVMFQAAKHLLSDTHLEYYNGAKIEKLLSIVALSGRRYFSSIILGGGTLINPLNIKIVQTALKQKIPVWTLGTGVGSCGFAHENQVNILGWKSLFEDFVGIGVRGPLSSKRLVDMGVKRTEIIGDLALSLTRENYCEPSDPPIVALNIALPSDCKYGHPPYQGLCELETLLKKLLRLGWRIVPFAMTFRDVPPITELLSRVSSNCGTIPIVATMDQFNNLIGSCTFSICVRLHAAVLSCCVGVPPFMIGYRDKCLDFMQSMKLDSWYVGLDTAAPNEIIGKAFLLSKEATKLRSTVLKRAQLWQTLQNKYVQDSKALEF